MNGFPARRHSAVTIAALTAGAVVTTALAGTSAAYAADAPSRITVRASDYTVPSGQEFVLRGRMTSLGEPVDAATVTVKAWRDGGWRALPGAVVAPRPDGRYAVRIVLSSGGDRDLRVVGNPTDDGIRPAREETVVRILG